MTILISDKIFDKNYYEMKRKYYIIIKGLINQEDITTKKCSSTESKAPKDKKQLLTVKGRIDS